MPPSVPARLGRYEVIRRIGKGSMGVVYLARDPVIRRMVALKTFRMDFAGTEREMEQYRARFMREAQSAGILTHPNIVTIHDVVEDEENDLAFIAMEYVRGSNLKELLEEGERFELDRVCGVVSQIAAALDYAHEKGVVHRDVKPANVLLDADGAVKVTDFGIARLESSNLTQEGQLLGTPNYMSPEQVLSRPLDHRTDIFSLGVLVYELLTRNKPFQGENFAQVSHLIVYEKFTDPRIHAPGLANEIVEVLDRALAKDPEERHQQAGELADDLLLSARLLADPLAAHSGVFDAVEAQRPRGRKGAATASPQEAPLDPPEEPVAPVPAPVPTQAPPPPPRKPAEPVVVVTREHADWVEPFRRGVTRLGTRSAELMRWGRAHLSLAFLGALAGVLGLSIAAALALRAVDDGAPPSIEMDPGHEARIELVPLLRDSRLALEQGDPQRAAELLSRAEELPQSDRGGVRALRGEVDSQLLEVARIERDSVRIEEGLQAAEEALADGRYEEAAGLAAGVLEILPDQADAADILARAEESAADGAAAPRSGSSRAPIPRRARTTRRPAVAPGTSDSTAAREAKVVLTFRSEIPEGVLAIFSGKEQVLRESFSFERTGMLHRHADGRLEREFTVPAGPGALRIHVAPAEGDSVSTVVEGHFSSDSPNRLEAAVSRSGEVTATLR